MGRIQEFLELYSSKNTKTVYRAGIIKFLELIYNKKRKNAKVTDEEMKEFERLADQYFSESRNYGEDLIRFASFLSKENIPPKTASAYIVGIKKWLEWNNKVKLPVDVIEEVERKKPKGGAWTRDKPLKKEYLKLILENSDIRGKSLFLLMAHTGLRLGEALSLELDDLELNENPPRIILRGKDVKTGEMREVFVTKEALQILKEWLDIRDHFLRRNYKKLERLIEAGKAKMNLQDKRVFPFSKSTAEKLWRQAIEKAGLVEIDKSTKRKTLTPHSLRKYFRTRLVHAKLPEEFINPLMGHGRSSLKQIYTKFSEEEILEMWKRAERELSVFGTIESEEIEQMKKKLEEKERELERKEKELEEKLKDIRVDMEVKLEKESILIRKIIRNIEDENRMLEQRVQKLEKDLDELRSYIVRLLKERIDSGIPFARTDEDIFERIKSEMPEFVTEE